MSEEWPRAEHAKFGTDAIHAGQDPEKWECRAVVPLIGLSTTFKQESPGVLRHGRYEYSRGGNPTRECLEECVAKLENGNHCMAYSSGLGATMSICEAFLQVNHLWLQSIHESFEIFSGKPFFFRLETTL